MSNRFTPEGEPLNYQTVTSGYGISRDEKLEQQNPLTQKTRYLRADDGTKFSDIRDVVIHNQSRYPY